MIETYAGQQVVHTYISGDLFEEERNRIGEETLKILDENHINKTIWDIREAKIRYSLTKIHLFAMNAKAAGLKDERSMALIYKDHHREYEHAKNVTQSLGLENLGYFQDLDEGIKWLISRETLSPDHKE